MMGIAGLLAGLALAAPVPLQQDFEARLQAARTTLARDLEAHAQWCHDEELFLDKQKAYELLLTLEPEHEAAHKALGFTKEKGSNAWKPPAKAKAFRNFDKKAEAEGATRWQALIAKYVEAMAALTETSGLPREQRDRAAAEALRFDPENARVHAVLGEVKSEKGVWVMPETERARVRRAEIAGFVKKALEEAPIAAPVDLNAREQAIPLPMKAVATPRLRVVGTVGEDELLLAAQAVCGIETLAHLALDAKYRLPADTTVFLFLDPSQKNAFLEHHPAVGKEKVAGYEILEGAGIPGTNDFAFWTGDSQRRIDGVVRLVLGYLMSGSYEITVLHGWAYEGFGLYLTRSLVRTRMTWLAATSAARDVQADMALRQKLLDPESNWMEEGYLLLSGPTPPKLNELLKKTANELSTEDVLASYVLASYLIEVRADKLPRMLERMGNGYEAFGALVEMEGMDLESFQRQLVRWLAERR